MRFAKCQFQYILTATFCILFASGCNQNADALKMSKEDIPHATLLAYANAVEHFDEEKIRQLICPDMAPEYAIQTFLAIGESGRKDSAKAIRSAKAKPADSTAIAARYGMQLKTPQGMAEFPINVLLLDGVWCIEEP